MIQRHIQKNLLQAAKEFPALALLGPRQSGKTTLLRALFPKAMYVHLEEPDILAFAQSDPRGFIQSYSRPVIFDEIQYAPNLVPYIKAEIDSNRNKRGEFLITGSQNFSLLNSMTESLAGRAHYATLFPFSSAEVESYTKKLSIETILFRGFYPELIAAKELENIDSFTRWQGSYVRTFIERDVRKISNVGDLGQFERFVRLLAARSGQLLNLSEVGRDAGVEQPTVKRWHSILQTGYITFELLPHHKNYSKRLIKSPKVYFIDVGICRYLSGIRDIEHLRVSQSFGSLFETLVVSDVKKSLAHEGEEADLNFFRSSEGIEVDLLVTLGKKIFPFEIKATATPGYADLSGLKTWMKLSGTKKGTVLCLVDKPMPLGDGITAMPWWEHAKVLG